MAVPSFPSAAEAKHEEGFLNSADHLRLYWQRYTPPSPKASVAVLHGGGDHSGRYPGITAALVSAGYQVALLDFRGHGQSDGRRFYVDTFTDYLSDLDAFVAKLSQDGVARDQLFVLAHSMGGLIAALWGLSRGRHVSGFVLTSPYFGMAIQPPPLKVLGAKAVGRFIPWLPVSTGIRMEELTSDPDHMRWTARDPLYGRATTPRWFEESLKTQRQVRGRAAEWSHPLLVLAGGADPIADISAMRAFVEAARSEDKEFLVYDGFRHEILNEVDREKPTAEAVAWLSRRTRPSRG